MAQIALNKNIVLILALIALVLIVFIIGFKTFPPLRNAINNGIDFFKEKIFGITKEKTNLEGVKLSAQDDASKQKEQHPEKAAGLA